MHAMQSQRRLVLLWSRVQDKTVWTVCGVLQTGNGGQAAANHHEVWEESRVSLLDWSWRLVRGVQAMQEIEDNKAAMQLLWVGWNKLLFRMQAHPARILLLQA